MGSCSVRPRDLDLTSSYITFLYVLLVPLICFFLPSLCSVFPRCRKQSHLALYSPTLVPGGEHKARAFITNALASVGQRVGAGWAGAVVVTEGSDAQIAAKETLGNVVLDERVECLTSRVAFSNISNCKGLEGSIVATVGVEING